MFDWLSNAMSQAAAEDLRPRERLPGTPHQELEQPELTARELELDLPAPSPARCRVEAKVANTQHRRPLDRAATHDRPQPGEQLLEGERLSQVVVGARIETANPVSDRVARCEQQHRRPDRRLAQPAHNRETIDPMQHHVENDGVVFHCLDAPQHFRSNGGHIDGVPLLAQRPRDQRRHLWFILNDEKPHPADCAPAEPRTGPRYHRVLTSHDPGRLTVTG